MEIAAIELRAISFDSIPTNSQVAEALEDIHKFLSRTAGLLNANGDVTAANPEIAAVLNASNLIKQAANTFGQNLNGLVVPASGPQVVGRR
jgi:hypothetical protein